MPGHQPGAYELEPGTEQEAEKSSGSGLECREQALVGHQEFPQDGTGYGAEKNPHGRDEHPHEKADDSPDGSGPVPSCKAGYACRDHIIEHCDDDRDRKPHKERSK